MNPKINDLIIKYFNIKNNLNEKIFDIGGDTGFNFIYSNHILGIQTNETNETNKKIIIQIDLDFDKFNFSNKEIYFSFCRHTLEDIQNPMNAFNEISRISQNAYIETPSPIIELFEIFKGDKIKGYMHHRYIVWSELDTNTLFFLPKYSLIEFIEYNNKKLSKFKKILNKFPIYWNNYYIINNNHQANIFVYRHNVNFNLKRDYATILNRAIFESIKYTNYFINVLKNY